MNQGHQEIFNKLGLGLGLCLATLLASCGDNNNNKTGNDVPLQSASDPRNDAPRIATTSAAKPKALFPEKQFAFLETYCLDCHDADTEKGGVNLEDLPFHIQTIEQAENWQKVLGP